MLKLEMVRFNFLATATHSVIYCNQGWLCFGVENAVRVTRHASGAATAIPEGLYSLSMMRHHYGRDKEVSLSEDGHRPYVRMVSVAEAFNMKGDIAVCYSLNTQHGICNYDGHALSALRQMVTKEKECFLSIRHLDDLQTAHLVRMASVDGR